jgi:hypothetical protein
VIFTPHHRLSDVFDKANENGYFRIKALSAVIPEMPCVCKQVPFLRRSCMRFVLFLSFIVITIFNHIHAQDRYIGVKGGFSISNLLGEGMDGLNSQLDAVSSNLDEKNLYWFTTGFFSSREILPDLFSIQTELLYLRNGKQWDITIDGTTYDINLSVDYLQFPWLVKLSLPVWLRPTIYTGPSISFMFRSRINNLPPDLDAVPFFEDAESGSAVYEYATNVFDIGLVSGLDVIFPFGPGFGLVDLRFNLGGLNVFNYPASDNIRSYNFLLMAGYAFNFGGGY